MGHDDNNYSICIYSYADSKSKEITMKIETSSSLVMSDQQGSDSNWEKIRQEVTCVICRELFKDPKSMPCLHTYCKKCLMEAVAKRPHDPDLPRDRPAINCPLCRAEVSLSDKGIEALPTNFSAARIVETVQLQDKLEKNRKPLCNSCEESDAVASCCDCRRFFLCEHCVKVHKNIPATKDHYLMTLKKDMSFTSVNSSPLCQKHPEELLKLYCQDCEVLVCRDCVLVQHKDHKYSFVDDLINEQKQKLKDITLQELDKILASTKDAITGVEQMQAKVRSCKDHHVTELNKTFQEITEMLNKRKEILLDEINQITEETSSPLKEQQGNLTTLKENIKQCHEFTRNTLQHGTNSEIMSARKQMLARTKLLKKHHDNSQLSPVTKPTKTVSYYLGKITTEIERVSCFVDLQQCRIEDLPSSVHAKETVTLNLILEDTKGKPICNAANTLTVEIATPPLATNVTPSVEELGDGKYSISFTPAACGDYVISIHVNGMHVSNSPAKIWCDLSDEPMHFESDDEEDKEFQPCVEVLSQSPPPVQTQAYLKVTDGDIKIENFSDDNSDHFNLTSVSRKTTSTNIRKKKERKKSKKNVSK